MNAALWEIARLRSLELYADQLQRMLGILPGQQGDLLQSIRKMLVDEPCVKEFPKLPPDAWECSTNGIKAAWILGFRQADQRILWGGERATSRMV